MIETTTEDIFDVKDGVILQVVECDGNSDDDMFKTLARLYPSMKEDYEHTCNMYRVSTGKLYGTASSTVIKPGFVICNIYGILSKKMLDKSRLAKAINHTLELLKKQGESLYEIRKLNMPIHIKKDTGCGYRKCEWSRVLEVIHELFDYSPLSVVIHV